MLGNNNFDPIGLLFVLMVGGLVIAWTVAIFRKKRKLSSLKA
jgi:hypothetical protein